MFAHLLPCLLQLLTVLGAEVPAGHHESTSSCLLQQGKRITPDRLAHEAADPYSAALELESDAEKDLQDPTWQWWLDLPEVDDQPASVKLAILLLIKNEVGNAKAWLDWIRSARRHGLHLELLIHASGIGPKEQENATATWPAEFRQSLLPQRAHTTWCDIVNAQVLLMRSAMTDPAISHMVFVDTASIPVELPWVIYEQLALASESRFCKSKHEKRAETWSLIRRSHARLLVDNHDGLRKQLLDKLHLVSEDLNPGQVCLEEVVWRWPLVLRDRRRQDMGNLSQLMDSCVMFVDWQITRNPTKRRRDWEGGFDHCEDCDALRACNRAKEAQLAHPATFGTLTQPAFQELLRSPFWFARKFEDGAMSEEVLDTADSTWRALSQGALFSHGKQHR
ncbi:unnamed protein product [Polarella glacialis]|uniref:Protein xylosyltransferase n=1 Tax=Polarella glacialis TaxID=89957 RepID=A0A813LJW3_POLGL|nr:unnamed protein product [Polarella glacialis]